MSHPKNGSTTVSETPVTNLPCENSDCSVLPSVHDAASPYRPNREMYKLKTVVVKIPLGWDDDFELYRSETHKTKLAQNVLNAGGDFTVHFLFSEWLHDRMYIKRVCGSKRLANELYMVWSIRYMVDVWIVIVAFIVTPVIGLATLGSALSVNETTPTWFPYLGTSFYVFYIPFIVFSILLKSECYQYMFDVDDKALKWFAVTITTLCFVTSPVYGVWALTRLSENDAVDENMGLYVGAYICCAFSLPLWIIPVYVVTGSGTDKYRRGVTFVNAMYTITGVVINGIVFASMIHQAVVGELVWFPYLGVVGLLFVIPTACTLVCLFALLAATEGFDILDESFEEILVSGICLLFVSLTDGMAWMLSSRNLNQPLEKLLDDQFLYSGAVFFYIGTILLGLYFVMLFVDYIRYVVLYDRKWQCRR